MGGKNYLEYLDSPEWWSIRRAAMRRANFRCENEKPGEPRHDGPLDIHHKHYYTLGCERLEDVEVLCRACHREKRIPKNRRMRVREQDGQQRLFDRWVNGVIVVDDSEAA